jgi:uncharacterized iron-regulated membrane protein
MGVSGSLVAFENEINRALNPKLTWVEPRTHRLSLAEMKDRLQKAYPGYSVLGLGIPPQPNMAWTTFMANEGLHKQIGVAFNPYTADVIGNLADGNNFTGRVHQFHLRLSSGQTGASIVTWAAIFLGFLSLSGIVMWWPRKILWVNWRRPFKLVNWDLHQALGIYLALFLMIFSVTAIVIHWDDAAMKLVNQIAGTTSTPGFPELNTPLPGAVPVSPDQLLSTAEATAPGAHATGMQFVGNLVRIWMKYPEDRTPGRTNVFVDQYTGKVVYLIDSRGAPLGYRVVKLWNREIHTGDIGGLPTRILACLASLMLPVLTITGPLVWFYRLGREEASTERIRDSTN